MSETSITVKNGQLVTPDHPTIPFIKGDGLVLKFGKRHKRFSMLPLTALMQANVRSTGCHF